MTTESSWTSLTLIASWPFSLLRASSTQPKEFRCTKFRYQIAAQENCEKLCPLKSVWNLHGLKSVVSSIVSKFNVPLRKQKKKKSFWKAIYLIHSFLLIHRYIFPLWIYILFKKKYIEITLSEYDTGEKYTAYSLSKENNEIYCAPAMRNMTDISREGRHCFIHNLLWSAYLDIALGDGILLYGVALIVNSENHRKLCFIFYTYIILYERLNTCK